MKLKKRATNGDPFTFCIFIIPATVFHVDHRCVAITLSVNLLASLTLQFEIDLEYPFQYCYGFKTTFTQWSSFLLKISYACAASVNGSRWVIISSAFSLPSITHCSNSSM